MRAKTALAKRLGAVSPRAVDVTFAVSITIVSLLLGRETHPAGWRDFDALGFVLTCAINLPNVVRRRAPMSVLVCCCLFWTWYIAAGYWPVINSAGAMLALYTVASRRPPRFTLLGATLVGAVWVYGYFAAQGGSLVSVVVQAVVFCGIVWRFGEIERQLVRRNEQLAQLTADLHREQLDRARRAVTEERLRLARELHDVVAHHMSVVSVQAGLGRYVFATDPPTAHAALDTIARTSAEALEEMRRLLTVLRVGPPDGSGPAHDPAPGLDRLGELVDRVGAAGVPVEVLVVGDPQPLAPGVQLCLYRVVQESLTNVLKHAGPARVTVTLEYRTGDVTVRITDDGAGVSQKTDGATSHGLIGMRERVRLYAGTLSAGPRPEGGFEVLVTVPTARTVPHDPNIGDFQH
jgi:signal transduction histidine kinase